MVHQCKNIIWVRCFLATLEGDTLKNSKGICLVDLKGVSSFKKMQQIVFQEFLFLIYVESHLCTITTIFNPYFKMFCNISSQSIGAKNATCLVTALSAETHKKTNKLREKV